MAEEVSSPNEAGAGGEAVDGGTPTVVDGSAAATTEKEVEEGREKWFIEMRGWIMVLAVQVASFTYQAGLNLPGRFTKPCPSTSTGAAATENEECTGSFRYKVFFYSNTTAFLTSLAIIILLMNRSFYSSLAKVTVLEIIVVLDMIGLMAAYWAGSTSKSQTNMFALVVTTLVLFVIYVVYTVQLVQKLHAVPLVRKLWGLFAAAVWRRMPAPAPNQQSIVINDGTRALPTLDIGRTKPELRSLQTCMRKHGDKLLGTEEYTPMSGIGWNTKTKLSIISMLYLFITRKTLFNKIFTILSEAILSKHACAPVCTTDAAGGDAEPNRCNVS